LTIYKIWVNLHVFTTLNGLLLNGNFDSITPVLFVSAILHRLHSSNQILRADLLVLGLTISGVLIHDSGF